MRKRPRTPEEKIIQDQQIEAKRKAKFDKDVRREINTQRWAEKRRREIAAAAGIKYEDYK